MNAKVHRPVLIVIADPMEVEKHLYIPVSEIHFKL